MRSAAICLLAIATPACNWVFGIDDVLLVDAALSIDAPLEKARLTWMVAVTDPQGNPVVAPTFEPITPTPSVQAGRPGEALTDATLDAMGVFELPLADAGAPRRIVYQLANDIPRELHWLPTMGREAHVIVPRYGRVDRAPIPGPNTTMSLTAPGSPDPHRAARVFTTGVWTESLPGPQVAGPTFNVNLNQSVQLSGPPGAPERLKGDLVVLSHFDTASGNCRFSSGSAAFQLDLIDGVSTTVMAETWKSSGIAVTASGDNFNTRLRTALSAGADPSALRATTQVGVSPNALMPAFSLRSPTLDLRGPLLLAMLDCNTTMNGMLPASFNLPDSLSAFPRLAQLQLAADRTVAGGAVLTSGLTSVVPVSNDMAPFDLTIAMPIAPFMFGTADLSTVDGTQLTAGTEPLVLTFGTEVMQTVGDYYEVVLHRVDGATVIPERAYTIITPSLTIERSVLVTGSQYVFQIRAFSGAPLASRADFTLYAPAQSQAVVWTHSFVAR